MAARNIEGFTLVQASLVCPECKVIFAKEVIVEIPPISPGDLVEADLHQVMRDPLLRPTMLAACPGCKYCTWATTFELVNLNPALFQRELAIESTKKFALAVQWSRKKRVHPLDIAFMAMNGLWCAREHGEPDELWLELATYEHQKAMQEMPSSFQHNGITHLIMAELWRQFGRFEDAQKEYKLAFNDSMILPEIVDHQLMLCQRRISSVTNLSTQVIEKLYPPVKEEEDLKVSAEELAILEEFDFEAFRRGETLSLKERRTLEIR